MAQESKTFGNDQDGEKNEQDERAGGVFGDLSFAQILASALAAGVSFSLSSQIGVAGSLIGAIVGAAAATVSSSVLNNLFSKSAEAIKGAVGPDDSSAPVAEKPAGSGAAGKMELMPHPVDAGKTVAAEASAATTQSVASSPADDTEVKFAPSGTRIAPASLRRAVHESQRRDTRKRLVVASVIAGVAAVLVSALLVYALTEGKGIGTTPGRTQETTTQTQTTQPEAEKPQETTQPEKPTESEDTESTGSTSETTADTSNSSTGRTRRRTAPTAPERAARPRARRAVTRPTARPTPRTPGVPARAEAPARPPRPRAAPRRPRPPRTRSSVPAAGLPCTARPRGARQACCAPFSPSPTPEARAPLALRRETPA